MASNKTSSTYRANPAEELAHWQAQRFSSMSDYEKILNERGNELLTLNEKVGPRSEPYKAARNGLHKAESEFERIHSVVRRPLNKHRVRWIYFAALALALALLEAPVNKYLFDVALGSTSFVSSSVSVVFAFFVLVLAHVAGRSLRQMWSEYRRRIVWTSVLLFLIVTLVLSGIVCILTVGRAYTSAVSELGDFQDLLSNVRSSVTSLGLLGTVAAAFSDISALVLATVNIGAIFMTMMVAFFSIDPDKDFDAAASEVEKNEAMLARLHKDYMRQREATIARHAPDLAGISANYKTANGKVIELKTKLGTTLDQADYVILDLRDTLSEDADHEEEEVSRGSIPQPKPDQSAAETSSQRSARTTPRVVAGDRA